MVILDDSNCGVLATLAPDYLRCVNEDTYTYWDDAGTNGVEKLEESASKAGQVLAWRMNGLLKRADRFSLCKTTSYSSGMENAPNAQLALKLDEASETSHSSVDDILHLAEIGKLVIYVTASRWRARRVTEIDHSIIQSHTLPTVYLRGPALPEIPSTDDKDFEEKCRRRIRLEQAQDIICGNVIEYGRYGSLKHVYELMFIGLQPISARTFQEYRVHPDATEILLDLNLSIGISANHCERLVYPNPKTLVSDALANRGLFVMAADVKH